MKISFIIGIIVIICFGTLLLSCQSDLKFDSDKWKNSGGENITLDIRNNMVGNLIATGILLNKNETEIIELIGKPARLQNMDIDSIKYFSVQEKYEWSDIDPKEMIFLEINFNNKGLSYSIKLLNTK